MSSAAQIVPERNSKIQTLIPQEVNPPIRPYGKIKCKDKCDRHLNCDIYHTLGNVYGRGKISGATLKLKRKCSHCYLFPFSTNGGEMRVVTIVMINRWQRQAIRMTRNWMRFTSNTTCAVQLMQSWQVMVNSNSKPNPIPFLRVGGRMPPHWAKRINHTSRYDVCDPKWRHRN